ncbi:MAG TPA: XRE family transcriptional regulator [Steroidobacteraceae bacterium]|nr:XRE family transcriptional regulator [Steroidobacteraceae bacterium]
MHALRSDLALQIARHVERLGISQLAAARQLHVPQPTLSKIANGHTSDLSLELLLRIAVRTGLRITLQTGLIPQEAGAFVSARRPSARALPSKIAAGARASLEESVRAMTPAERLEAFVEHNQLVHELREAGGAPPKP